MGIEEQLIGLGFSLKNGLYVKEIAEPVKGVVKANPASGMVVFSTDEDDYETYDDVPDLARAKMILASNAGARGDAGQPCMDKRMGEKLREAMDRIGDGHDRIGGKRVPAGSIVPGSSQRLVFGVDWKNLPSEAVITMGGKPYITKAGLSFVARVLGIRVRVEPVRWSFEKHPDGQRVSIFKGIATTPDGAEYVDYGIATEENTSSMIVKGGNLDHMAATRAANRAIRMATACGYCSIEEAPDAPSDVLEAEFSEV